MQSVKRHTQTLSVFDVPAKVSSDRLWGGSLPSKYMCVCVAHATHCMVTPRNRWNHQKCKTATQACVKLNHYCGVVRQCGPGVRVLIYVNECVLDLRGCLHLFLTVCFCVFSMSDFSNRTLGWEQMFQSLPFSKWNAMLLNNSYTSVSPRAELVVRRGCERHQMELPGSELHPCRNLTFSFCFQNFCG